MPKRKNNNLFIVYCHTNKINGKKYVGITSTTPQLRWQNGYGYRANKHFYSAIKKYGWEEFHHEILFEGLTEEEACEKEKYLIKKWNLTNQKKGYNNSYGGEHGKHSLHTREKMRMAQLGEKGHWYGKKMSMESRLKMSLSKKGKIPKSNPPKRIKCLNNGIVYESLTDASRKLGVSLAGVWKSCNNKKPIKGFIFIYEEVK